MKLKKSEKQKEPKKKRREKKQFLRKVSAENLTGYDDIICAFAPSTFNLSDQPTKTKCVLKS